MAEPNAAELKALVKSGAAMPDGSFYIRDGNDLGNAILAVGRAQPTNDESEVARRNAVRRHIMKRAGDLKLSSQIPDTWGPDGSLKHSQLEEFLAHHGIKGMHWGVRTARSESGSSGPSDKHAAKIKELNDRATEHERVSAAHARVAIGYQHEAADLEKNGLHSTAFKRVYGKDAATQGEWAFYGKNGQSKAQALAETHNNLRLVANQHTRAANSHAKKAAKYREKAAKLQHAATGEEFLAHFGRKGMKWGEHVFGTDRSGSSTHPDAHNTNLLKAKVQQHGTGSLSTSELQTLVTRLNVEKQYNNLSPHEVSLGRHVVSELLSETGTVGRNVARQTVTEVSKKYAVQGLEAVIKSAIK